MDNIHEQIERRAYELFQARGGQDGYHIDDWLQAEKEIAGAVTKKAAAVRKTASGKAPTAAKKKAAAPKKKAAAKKK